MIAALDPTEPTSTPAVMISLLVHCLPSTIRLYSRQRQNSSSSFTLLGSFIFASPWLDLPLLKRHPMRLRNPETREQEFLHLIFFSGMRRNQRLWRPRR